MSAQATFACREAGPCAAWGIWGPRAAGSSDLVLPSIATSVSTGEIWVRFAKSRHRISSYSLATPGQLDGCGGFHRHFPARETSTSSSPRQSCSGLLRHALASQLDAVLGRHRVPGGIYACAPALFSKAGERRLHMQVARAATKGDCILDAVTLRPTKPSRLEGVASSSLSSLTTGGASRPSVGATRFTLRSPSQPGGAAYPQGTPLR